MNSLMAAALASALLVAASGAPAMASATTDIDFSGLPMGMVGPNGVPGMIFTGASVLPATGNPNFPTHAGDQLIYNSRGNTITIDLLFPDVTGVGAYVTAGAAFMETAYSDGAIVGTDGFAGANYRGAANGLSPNQYVQVTGSDITRITFTAGTSLDTFTLADLAIITGGVSSVPTVPEPASFAVLAAGLVGVAATRLRR